MLVPDSMCIRNERYFDAKKDYNVSNAPKNVQDVLKILRYEAMLRKEDKYISQTRSYVDAGVPPPRNLTIELQKRALK